MTKISKINVYANSIGWLFDDLKARFAEVNLPGIQVIVSDQPDPQCDAWIAVRSKEIGLAPDLSRTVACIHDMRHGEDVYQPGGERGAVSEVGAIVLSHPQQRDILAQYGIDVKRPIILDRPLGALADFTCRESMPNQFTVGCIGRDSPRKRFDWTLPIAKILAQNDISCHFELLGNELEPHVAELSNAGISCAHYPRHSYPYSEYPKRYQSMDCLLITSHSEAGPLTLFESLACGVPAVSTPVGWAPIFEAREPQLVRTADSVEGLAQQLIKVYHQRQQLFERRQDTRALISDYQLDDWFVHVLNLAVYLHTRNPEYLAQLDSHQLSAEESLLPAR
ncbi:MAG: glycosyltransferase involved in cell wall biosynthesis [Phenylobacterium sp.]